jgi:polysaccharide deacetylase family protein (PEP-CTERM system associated)
MTAVTAPLERRPLAFSIDFEGFVEGMEESFSVSPRLPRFDIERELQENAERCLALLARHHVRATFFVLGWIAERYPALVRTIAAEGHEIGSHSLLHRRLWALPEATARAYIGDSRKLLADVSGQEVSGFRAPDFSLSEKSPLVAALAASGYRYDSSINPTNIHDVYGSKVRRATIFRLPSGVVEFPIPTVMLAGRFSVTVGGGGYFRLFPYWLTRRLLARREHLVTYLHPYEIGGVFPHDHGGSPMRRFRHTFRCGGLDARIERLFRDFRAIPVIEYLRGVGFIN